jgi:LPPG:FO 2-phospho-L-lactate transferase
MLGGVNNRELGWGRAGESFRTVDELARFGVDTWFRLGDQDLATHLFRTERLRAGAALSTVTAEIAAAFGIEARLLPVSDDPVRTRVTVATADGERDLAMQEWFVRERCEPPVRAVRFEGAEAARPAPGVLEALRSAQTIVLCPSNPVISIGPVLAIPGIRDVLADRRDRVVAVSPLVGGAPVKGPADRLMGPLGIEVSSVGVARHYRDLCGSIVIDTVDAADRDAIEALGVAVTVTDTMMRDSSIATALARTTLGAVTP